MSKVSVNESNSIKTKQYRLILPLLFFYLVGLTNSIPSNIIIYSTFAFVFLLSLNFASQDLIRATFFLFVFNGIMRRLAASDSDYYASNDILILLPYVPILILLLKNLKTFQFETRLLVILYFICFFSIMGIPESAPGIVWGLINLTSVVILGQISKQFINDALVSFIIKLGVVTSTYIFFQKIALPFYDLGWCQSRKSALIYLEDCTSNSLRLWGTMESAVNMACFLTVCFLLLALRSKQYISISTRLIGLTIIFSAIFLTGTRTFIFLIPIALFLTLLFFKKLSIAVFVFGSLGIALIFTLLPNLAIMFNYQSRWVDRLDIANISGDRSLKDRLDLAYSFNDQVTLKNLMIGDGLGSKSRGALTIDNGFISLILEIGLPLTIVLMAFIIIKLKNGHNSQNSLVVQSWSVCILLLLANSSFVVLTGSSSVYLWFFLFMFDSKSHSDKVRAP